MIQDHFMRPNATRRNNWVQLGIGAAALLLPPLALGAAFYSMLAEPDEEVTRPAVAQAVAPPVPQPPVVLPATIGAEPPGSKPPPAGKSTEGATPTWERLPGQGSPVQASPIQVATTPAATVNPPADAEGGVTPPAAESPPAPAAPKRNVRRHAPRPQQDPFPVRTWLQQMGILPRNTGG
jgi:hypothetical protein